MGTTGRRLTGGTTTGTPVPDDTWAASIAVNANAVLATQISGEYALLGREVRYQPYGAAEKPIQAILSFGAGEESKGADAMGVKAVMRVMISDINQVKDADQVIIGSSTWGIVTSDLAKSGLEWICEINRINR